MKTTAKGFTLIELLVVITIIGILATGATAVYSGAQAKARDSIRQNDANAIATAQEMYANDNQGTYSLAFTGTGGLIDSGYMKEAPSVQKNDSTFAGVLGQIVMEKTTGPDGFMVVTCGMSNGTDAADSGFVKYGIPKATGVTVDCTLATAAALTPTGVSPSGPATGSQSGVVLTSSGQTAINN